MEPRCAAIVAGVLSLVLSLVLLTLPASPVLQMKLCAWRMAMQLRDGKRVANCESGALRRVVSYAGAGDSEVI